MPYKEKDKQREFGRKWISERRRNFFCDKSCVRCKSKERLELDHVDRENKISNSIWSWSEDRRNEEIKKCQVLCYFCHKDKTKGEYSKTHCIHGHNFSVTGRDRRNGVFGKGGCSECRRIYDKKRRLK